MRVINWLKLNLIKIPRELIKINTKFSFNKYT